MEYLNSFNDDLKKIDEKDIVYYDLLKHPEFFHGNVNLVSDSTIFSKYGKYIRNSFEQYGKWAVNQIETFHDATCGVRLRFETNSNKVIFKIKLKRKWEYVDMLSTNSSGFDVYTIKNDEYTHKTFFAPDKAQNIFVQDVYFPSKSKVCVFLPNFNSIQEFHIGIEKNKYIDPLNYLGTNNLPIIFYGNSLTQGCGASRSGNAYPNIVSKKLDHNIINFSCSSCCRGTIQIAQLIGKINCDSIIIDYSRDSSNKETFLKTYEKFYNKIREYHPDKKIILLTSSNNTINKYKEYDNIIENTYQNAKVKDEKTYIIKQYELFDDDERDLFMIDSNHYTDYAMDKIGNKICELLKE